MTRYFSALARKTGKLFENIYAVNPNELYDGGCSSRIICCCVLTVVEETTGVATLLVVQTAM